jgi:type VI secretion system protein ImpL
MEVEAGLKQNFCDQFRDGIIIPLDDWLTNITARFAYDTPDEFISGFIAHLVRRINLLKARREKGGLATLHELPQPRYIQTSTQTNPAIITEIEEKFSNLYLYYLRWRSDSGGIDEEAQSLQKLLNYLVTERRRNLQWLVAWANGQDTLSPIIMQDFWSGADFGSQPPAVAPAYTAAGKKHIDAFILELESALPSGSPPIARQKLEFQSWYRQTYLQAWHNFGNRFHTGADSLKDPEQRRQMASRMGTEQNPYFELLFTMNAAFKPFAEDPELPAWVQHVFAFQNLHKEAKILAKAPDQQPGILRKATQKVKSKIAKLNRQTGLKAEAYWNPEEKVIAARALADYQTALKTVSEESTPQEAAYNLAVKLFTDDPARSQAAFFIAARTVNAFKSSMPPDPSDKPVFWQLVDGPLDFFRGYISDESACHLQDLWERDVLWQVNSVPDGYEKIQRLVGKGGYAKQFVEQGPAAPFITISLQRGYRAKSVKGFSLPFESSFFSFLNKGTDLPERLKDKYAVIIRGLPTRANPDARILPKATRLELQCGNTMYLLINRNYPIKRTFNWSRHDCGDVRLQIMVGNLVLTKNYTGSQAFAEFLRDFADGLRRFSPDEFPQESSELKSFGIQFIEVSYKLSGHDEIIHPPGPSVGSVPQRIVRCGSP